MKFLWNYIYIQNMDEITLTGWAWKIQNFIFLPFLAVQIFIAHMNIQIHVTGSIFIVIFFKCSWQCPPSESITIEITPKDANYHHVSPSGYHTRQFFFIMRFYAIVHRRIIVDNKIIGITSSCYFSARLILIDLT